MPALVKSSVGSLAGTSEDECTRLCPLLSKKRRNFSRISEPVGIRFYCTKGLPQIEASERGRENCQKCQNCQKSPKLKCKTFATQRNRGSRGICDGVILIIGPDLQQPIK